MQAGAHAQPQLPHRWRGRGVATLGGGADAGGGPGNARRGVEFSEVGWDTTSHTLTLRLRARREIAGLTVLCPAEFEGLRPKTHPHLRLVRLEGIEQLACALDLSAGEEKVTEIAYGCKQGKGK